MTPSPPARHEAPLPRTTDALRSGVRMRRLHGGRWSNASWNEIGSLDLSSFGMVLGAGGMTGGAFETGVMLAMQWDHGIEADDADVVVGTSAGSIGGTLLSLGFDAEDIAAMLLGAEQHLTPHGRELLSLFDVTVPAVPLYRLFRVPTPQVMLQAATHLAHGRMRMMAMEWLRRGELDPRTLLHAFDTVEWPDDAELKICVTDASNGARVVLDRNSSVRLIDAVAASCSVPSVMKPVEWNGRMFIDGGVWSPTNADLLAGPDGPSTVVIVSPMSGTHAGTLVGRVSSRFATRRLGEELRAFHPSQTVLVIEPTNALSMAVVDDALDVGAVRDVVLGAFTGPAMANRRGEQRSAPLANAK